jgi:acetyl-CoA carboxylase biotin carboxyl carrier protein
MVTAPTALPQAVSIIDAWTPDGVIRVISALREAGLSGCQVALVEGERRLEITLGDAAQIAPTAAPAPLPSTSDLNAPSRTGGPIDTDTLTAPMLGVFYRRPTPDEPPFAAPGETVSAGQTVGLIEVMKTFNEVVAPRDCTIEEFLVENGAYVEYGQVIARIR